MSLPPDKIFRVGPNTDRLTLRAFEVHDAEAFWRLRSDPDVIRYTGDEPLANVAEAVEAINAYPDFEQYGFGRWACIEKSSGRCIGFSGLKYLEEFAAVDIGYRFLPEYWGKGFATESALACLRFGFETIALEQIIGLVMPDNVASARVLHKLGMQRGADIVYLGHHGHRYEIDRSTWVEHFYRSP